MIYIYIRILIPPSDPPGLSSSGTYAEADAAEATQQMLLAVGYLHAHHVPLPPLPSSFFLLNFFGMCGNSVFGGFLTWRKRVSTQLSGSFCLEVELPSYGSCLFLEEGWWGMVNLEGNLKVGDPDITSSQKLQIA